MCELKPGIPRSGQVQLVPGRRILLTCSTSFLAPQPPDRSQLPSVHQWLYNHFLPHNNCVQRLHRLVSFEGQHLFSILHTMCTCQATTASTLDKPAEALKRDRHTCCARQPTTTALVHRSMPTWERSARMRALAARMAPSCSATLAARSVVSAAAFFSSCSRSWNTWRSVTQNLQADTDRDSSQHAGDGWVQQAVLLPYPA